MKIAAARALAELARQQVPEEVAAAYGGARSFGPDYIIPAPFDPRLIEEVPLAGARAAMDSGVARRPLPDEAACRSALRARMKPPTAVLASTYAPARPPPQQAHLTIRRTSSRKRV